MRGERGAASMLGMVLTMVILVLAAWFFMKNSGFLGGGEEGEQTPIDQAETVSVIMELRTIRQSLELYRNSSPELEYPGSSAIHDLESLRSVLPKVFPLPEELSFDFSSYVSRAADEYLLKVRAHDSVQTMFEVGSGFGPRKVQP